MQKRWARHGTKELIGWARERGWSAETTSGGHVKLSKPGRGLVFVSSTAGDNRSQKNAKSDILRAERLASNDRVS